MNNVTFSLEKGFRIFQKEINFFHFFMVQFEIGNQHIKSGDYTFQIYNKNIGHSLKKIFIDTENQRIVTYNSHEDPLVYEDGIYYICFQIEIDLLKQLKNDSKILFLNSSNHIISEATVCDLNEKYLKYDGTHYSSIFEKKITTTKDCFLTLHLGNKLGEYKEERLFFKSNTFFDFSEYIKKYEYIGLQCSYENEEPEIEEKHIVIGQKGIHLSGFLKINKNLIINPPLFFKPEYQKEYDKKDFKLINSIEELLLFYIKNNKKPNYFESTLSFLLPGYLNQLTYNQDGIYSDNKISKKNHFVLEVCKKCSKNYKCLQVIPSGLSEELFKKNIVLEDQNNCTIYTKLL